MTKVRALGAAIVAFATPVALGKEGEGRISGVAGVHQTSQAFLLREASSQGVALQASGFGPYAEGVFGYFATDSIEVNIDPFLTYERILGPDSSVMHLMAYGVLFGARFHLALGGTAADLAVGLATGPTVASLSGEGPISTSESLTQLFGGSLGFQYRFDSGFAALLQYRLMLGRGLPTELGRASISGHWVGIGLTTFVAGKPDDRPR